MVLVMDDVKIVHIGKTDSASRVFMDGSKRTIQKLPSLVVGYGVYIPGWKWSVHAGPQTGKSSEKHIGWIQSGNMIIRTEDGNETEVGPGDFFEVGPNHDAWVSGNEPCIALDFTFSSNDQRSKSSTDPSA